MLFQGRFNYLGKSMKRNRTWSVLTIFHASSSECGNKNFKADEVSKFISVAWYLPIVVAIAISLICFSHDVFFFLLFVASSDRPRIFIDKLIYLSTRILYVLRSRIALSTAMFRLRYFIQYWLSLNDRLL